MTPEHHVSVTEWVTPTERNLTVYLHTVSGPCPGNLAVWQRKTSPTEGGADLITRWRDDAEAFAYVLAKQVGAAHLNGVSERIQGFFLAFMAEKVSEEA